MNCDLSLRAKRGNLAGKRLGASPTRLLHFVRNDRFSITQIGLLYMMWIKNEICIINYCQNELIIILWQFQCHQNSYMIIKFSRNWQPSNYYNTLTAKKSQILLNYFSYLNNFKRLIDWPSLHNAAWIQLFRRNRREILNLKFLSCIF